MGAEELCQASEEYKDEWEDRELQFNRNDIRKSSIKQIASEVELEGWTVAQQEDMGKAETGSQESQLQELLGSRYQSLRGHQYSSGAHLEWMFVW